MDEDIPCSGPASASSKKKLDGGDVILIILFVGSFVYFGGGMALNLSRGGSAKLPHSEFWTSLPGYTRQNKIDMFCHFLIVKKIIVMWIVGRPFSFVLLSGHFSFSFSFRSDSYIVDGINFSICGCCGLRGGSGPYTKL